MYVPANKANAVQEVVIGLHFTRPWTGNDIKELLRHHEDGTGEADDCRWHAFLPKASVMGLPEIKMPEPGSAGSPIMEVREGVAFERFQPNGAPHWRLELVEQLLVVRCFRYDGWDRVWPKAFDLLSQIAGCLPRRDLNLVDGVLLQYRNLLTWEGPLEGYFEEPPLRVGKGRVPQDLFADDPRWHLDQGWFDDGFSRIEGDRPSRSRLRRYHIRSSWNADAANVLLEIDALTQDTLGDHRSLATITSNDPDRIATAFDVLHTAHKTTLREYFSDGICGRIGL